MDIIVIAGLALPAAVLYTVPTLIAHHRRLPATGAVIAVNLFLGWTVAGWVAALAMAVRQDRSQPGRACPAGCPAGGEPADAVPGNPGFPYGSPLN